MLRCLRDRKLLGFLSKSGERKLNRFDLHLEFFDLPPKRIRFCTGKLPFSVLNAGKDSLHSVEVTLKNRVELVVVTASAPNG